MPVVTVATCIHIVAAASAQHCSVH